MRRNRLDFVGPGNVAGQVRELKPGPSRTHTGTRDDRDAKGNLVPAKYTYTLPGVEATIWLHGHPFVYRVRAIDGEHGPQLAELYIHQPNGEADVPLTADDVRKLAKYLDRLAYAAVHGLSKVSSAEFHKPEKKRPGRRGHGDEFYAEIADFARQAHRDRLQTGRSVRESIAERYNVTRDTADQWLARARRAGHLQAGELGGQSKPRKGAGR